MENKLKDNSTDEKYRGDERIVRKIFEYKFIARFAVILLAFLFFAKVIDSIVETKENLSKLSEQQNNFQSKSDLNKNPIPIRISEPNIEGQGLQKKGDIKTKIKKTKKYIDSPPPSSLSNIKKAENKIVIDSINVENVFYDKNGDGIEGVEIWCTNCLSTKREMTDKKGNFTLTRTFELKNTFTQHLNICFKYKGKKSCFAKHFKYLNDLDLPNFNSL